MTAPAYRYVVLDSGTFMADALEARLNELGEQGYRLLTPGIGALFIMEWFDRDT